MNPQRNPQELAKFAVSHYKGLFLRGLSQSTSSRFWLYNRLSSGCLLTTCTSKKVPMHKAYTKELECYTSGSHSNCAPTSRLFGSLGPLNKQVRFSRRLDLAPICTDFSSVQSPLFVAINSFPTHVLDISTLLDIPLVPRLALDILKAKCLKMVFEPSRLLS